MNERIDAPIPPLADEQAQDITRLLIEWRQGESGALDRLMPLVYRELHSLAGRYMRRERQEHTFAATDLVHEAYLRLADKTHPQWRDRVHFYAVAAQVMRRILVDHARRVRAAKRGGDMRPLPLEAIGEIGVQQADDLVVLDDALKALSAIDPRKSRTIELRFFGGLTIDETAEFLKVSTATVINDTRTARAWLQVRMTAQPQSQAQ